MRRACVLLLTILAFVEAPPQSSEWRQWRGPDRDGIASSFTPPANWPERPTPVWKVDAGIGHSSPVVSGGRVFLFSRIGEQEVMTAYHVATGRQLWRQSYDAPYQMNAAARGHGKGPKGTPVVDGSRLYALGISGVLSAFDAGSGTVLWRHDFSREFASRSPEYGAATSPLVDGEHVITHVGGRRGGAIRAFTRTAGVQKWSWKGDGPAYASPVIGTFGGTRHLITQTQSLVLGLSPDDGTELWRIPFTTSYHQNSVTPVIAGDLVIYSGLWKPTAAVRLVQKSGAWMPERVWENPDVPMYMSSPVAVGGVLYGLTHRNRGQFFALDIATGKTLWTSPPRQSENAALAAARGVVIATTTEGKIVVMRQGKTYELVREYSIADTPVWAHPAFHGSGMLIKDLETLAYWTL